MWGQANDFGVTVFSNSWSRKLVTSFVFLQKLTSFSDEWSMLKKSSWFLSKETEPSRDFKLSIKGGKATSWDYVHNIKNNLKHIFTKFHLFTNYRFWDNLFQSEEISLTVLPVKISSFRKWCLLFKLSFTLIWKLLSAKLQHELVLQQEYFYKLNGISQFLRN